MGKTEAKVKQRLELAHVLPVNDGAGGVHGSHEGSVATSASVYHTGLPPLGANHP